MRKESQSKPSIFSQIAVVAGCVLLFAGMAHAIPITYDFTGNAATNPLGLGTGDLGTNSVTVSFGGLDVTITGKDSGAPGLSSNLARGPIVGLGVVDALAATSIGPDEAIEFDFSPAEVVAVDSFLVEFGALGGELEFFVDGMLHETVIWAAGMGPTLFNHTFSGSPQGKILEFRGKTDDFRITELTVDPVPEPGTLALLSAGLLGLCVYARRNKKGQTA